MFLLRSPVFRDPHGLPPPRHPTGRRVLAIVAPTDCDARGVRKLWRALRKKGVTLGIATECHGEARAEKGRPLHPDCLLIEVRPEAWDAVVFAGGKGAERVAGDAFARDLGRKFAQAGRRVASLGAGQRVLETAHLDGIRARDPAALANCL